MSDDLLSPTSDLIFKKIFGEHKSIFIGFISAVLQKQITEVEFIEENKERENLKPELTQPFSFLNVELSPEVLKEKFVRLDVCAKLSDGTLLNVEVQIEKHIAFEKRSFFYGSRLYTSQLKEGNSYQQLKKTVCINILDFALFPNTPHFFSHYLFLNAQILQALKNPLASGQRKQQKKYKLELARVIKQRTNTQPLETIELFFLELPKLKKKAYNKLSPIEKWAVFFSTPKIKDLREIAMGEPALKQAVNELEKLSSDPMTRELYEIRMKFVRDVNSRVFTIREEGKAEGKVEGKVEGRAEGRAEGKAEGRAEGRAEGKAEGKAEGIDETSHKIARNMKSEGFALPSIAKVTGLPLSEIENF